MGVLTNPCNRATMATAKPKERQFQVVPVPGTFTRGRWECWDYRDVSEPMILEFADKSALNAAEAPSTLPAVGPNPTNGNAAAATAHAAATLAGGEAIVPVNKESSTIVVTSIAPAPNTLSRDFGETEATKTQPTAATQHPNGPSQVSMTTNTETVDSYPRVIHAPNAVSNVSAAQQPLVASQIVDVSHQSSLYPQTEQPTLSRNPSNLEADETESTVSASVTSNANTSNVAIDNKIEQAMDLVKTHLTFAVREEVEILRSTIADLEAKVASLESQNQVLRQFAPPEIIANLPNLMQNSHAHRSMPAPHPLAQMSTPQTGNVSQLSASTPAAMEPQKAKAAAERTPLTSSVNANGT